MIFKNIIISFLIGYFVSIITIGYLYLYFKNYNMDTIFIVVPILYGIFSIINYFVIKININYSIIIGILFGLLLSIIGRFIYKLPIKIFNFNKNNEYKVHIYAIIMYGLIFRLIITNITKYLL